MLCYVRAGLRKPVPIFAKEPVAAVSRVDIDHIDAVDAAGRNADQWVVGIFREHPCDACNIGDRSFISARNAGAFIRKTRKDVQGPAFKQNLTHGIVI